MKDNFIKQKKKISTSSDPRRTYMYFRQLSFLRESDATTDSNSNFEQKNEQKDIEDHSTPTLVPNISKSHSRPTVVPNYGKNLLRQNHDTKKRRLDLEPSRTDSVKIVKTSQDSVKTVLELKPPHSPSTVAPNPDRLFFESILPYMNSFTEDQKLEFRCEVLNLIKRIRAPQQKDSPQQDSGYPKTSNTQHSSSPYTSYDSP